MPCIPERRDQRDCGMVIGEADIGVPHDQTYNIYGWEKYNPLLVDWKYVLILHKYFAISCSISSNSTVLKW